MCVCWQGLALERIAPVSIDAALHDVTVRAGGARVPLLTASALSASGLLIRARQLTATPRTRELRFAVGRLHQACVMIPIKGCRYVLVVYTQIHTHTHTHSSTSADTSSHRCHSCDFHWEAC